MKITSPCVVALTWTLKDSLGEVLDELTDPVEFMVGGEDLLVKIEQSMLGLGSGDKLKLHLEPEDAFGLFNEALVFLESRALFPPELEVGMTIEGHALPVGCNPDAPSDIFYTVTDLYPDHVVLDGNHPLAGLSLYIDIRVADVREASVDEVGRGSAGTGFFKIVPQAPGGASLH
jgi:FKBP-type peptidyl-prolyl cis-trans isomerase SlyD